MEAKFADGSVRYHPPPVDTLLDALIACAGVTLKAVSTALAMSIRGGTVHAEGDREFRGTDRAVRSESGIAVFRMVGSVAVETAIALRRFFIREPRIPPCERCAQPVPPRDGHELLLIG